MWAIPRHLAGLSRFAFGHRLARNTRRHRLMRTALSGTRRFVRTVRWYRCGLTRDLLRHRHRLTRDLRRH
ncbi:hypothetical protein A5621_10480 [Mycobacterium colombiense]|nr:hypothetical protein A5620_04030 [Mycobacterium colombiense]OBJ40792.1 hypothetical protein A5621_10480 [Mycobacterium colombiense]